MTAKRLPERPDLEQLKRQAKDLLRSARAHEADALARFRVLPAFANAPDDAVRRTALGLHDAQSVIARELGFESWNTLRDEVEALTIEFGAAVDEFVEAATDGRPDRARRLLALYPRIAHATLSAELVRGDAAAVEARLRDKPSLANETTGPRGWQPIHYVCHTALAHGSEELQRGLADTARVLLAHGVDPRTRFPWEHHGVRRPVLHGAVMTVGSLPLARALLEAGADPNDGVTLPLAAGSSNIAALELLLAHGASPNQPWATTGHAALYEILHWARDPRGAMWLLGHGADANSVSAANGEGPLHVAAASWDVPLVDELVRRGAEIDRPRADGRTPYALAIVNANQPVAAWLLEHGASSEVSDVDRFVAACCRGDLGEAQAMLQAQPELRGQIGPEHYGAFYQAAENNDTRALGTMLTCGFDPDRPDESIGKTALHAAAMAGRVDATRLLLEHGASVAARDREFKAPPLIWAAEGARNNSHGDRDHAEVGRLLLAAGSPVEWSGGAEPSEAIVDIVNRWRGSTVDA